MFVNKIDRFCPAEHKKAKMGKCVIEVLKIMYLALFFSGCNHYKSVHFAPAKIQRLFDIIKKERMPQLGCILSEIF
jgi:hypothetical protein